jgi:membrane-bound serine protease (ClpP class)
MIGREAVVRSPLRPRGQVFIEGALWQAVADAGQADVGDTVIVRGVEGLLLHVAPTGVTTNPVEGAVQ